MREVSRLIVNQSAALNQLINFDALGARSASLTIVLLSNGTLRLTERDTALNFERPLLSPLPGTGDVTALDFSPLIFNVNLPSLRIEMTGAFDKRMYFRFYDEPQRPSGRFTFTFTNQALGAGASVAPPDVTDFGAIRQIRFLLDSDQPFTMSWRPTYNQDFGSLRTFTSLPRAGRVLTQPVPAPNTLAWQLTNNNTLVGSTIRAAILAEL